MSAETVSLVIPVRNEGPRVAVTLDSIFAGTRLPEEIIIADGRSTDDTVARCAPYRDRGVRLTVVDNPEVYSGGGRNAGVAASSGSIIVLADCGNTVASDWLEQMVQPFLSDPAVDLVCGIFTPLVDSDFEHCYAAIQHFQNYHLEEYADAELEAIRPAIILPGGGTIAMRRSVFERVGGYPSWLHRAQDKLFSRKAYALGVRVAVSWHARIQHHMRSNVRSAAQISFQYGRGNGRSRYLSRHTIKLAFIYAALLGGCALSVLWPPAGLPTLAFLIYYTYRAGVRKAWQLARGRSRIRLLPHAALVLWARDLGTVAGHLVGWCEWLFKPSLRRLFWSYMRDAPRERIMFLEP